MAEPIPKQQHPEQEFTPLTPEQVKQRRGRVLATAWAVAAMAFLFMAVTYVRLGDRMLQRHKPADQAQRVQSVPGQEAVPGHLQAQKTPLTRPAASE